MRFLGLLLFLMACASGREPINFERFQSVQEGISEDQLVKTLGKPDKIKSLKDGAKEFEYLENVKIVDRTIEVHHYYFHIKDGMVYLKKQENDPFPYEKSSHDLETTELKF